MCLIAYIDSLKPPPSLNPDRGTVNCMGCTIAYDLTCRGYNVQSRSFDPDSFKDTSIIHTFYPDIKDIAISADDYRSLKDCLLNAGERGYLRYTRDDQTRHMVIYERIAGKVYIVNAQTSDAKVPLWLFYHRDKGHEYYVGRLDNISVCLTDFADAILIWQD